VFTYLAAEREVDGKHHQQQFPLAALLSSAALFELSGPMHSRAGIASKMCAPAGATTGPAMDGPHGSPEPLALAPADDKGAWTKPRARRPACGGIHSLLSAGLTGARWSTARASAPVAPATSQCWWNAMTMPSMQQALAAAGIPCVAAGRSSLYQTESATLCWLFEALLRR
jgi:hypothetical protein